MIVAFLIRSGMALSCLTRPLASRLGPLPVAGALALALIPPAGITAQALPFHAETAITTGFEESAARTFSAFMGRSDLRADGSTFADPMQRDIDVFVQALALLPYAPTAKWTTRVVLPFVSKSMDFTDPTTGTRQSYSATGVGDVLIDSKWIFFTKNRLGGTLRVGIEGGVKIPLGSTGEFLPDGTEAPRPLQVGTGSWDFPLKALFTLTQGRYGIIANTGYRINTANEGFEAGNVFSYDLALGLRLRPQKYRSINDDTLVFYLELNGSVTNRDRLASGENPNSGGHLLFLSPDIQWIPTPWLLFEASLQLPVVRNLNGTQLDYGTRFQLGSRIRFSFVRM
jgi:hypothetical protein